MKVFQLAIKFYKTNSNNYKESEYSIFLCANHYLFYKATGRGARSESF